ncbi:ligand-gated channel [Pectobacterium actinidiae]|uniref:Ligand-gated channel n=1 Tax=Pectobacterium actinidiae TaxID=1507808 RepID=A0A1V2R8H7_9GAMM|nr:TonB-dependent siderophore receptor [Pectobacterium actinidiae]KHN90515.1 putative TonB-dependent ferrichrome receptor [Pectobacterium actinidiae]ONK07374.1 ligand-gated channel [Pectobacterium actinidiae]ONK08708.1 ligand-gated channel [Pectobacterium actinidiae]
MVKFRTHLLARTLRAGVLGASFASVLPMAAVYAASAASVQQYTVSSGPLNQVLNQFAQQAGVLLSYDPAVVAGKHGAGLRGNYSVEQGFQQILSNSGLSAQYSADGSVTLVQRTASEPVSVSAPVVAKNDRIVVTAPPNTAMKLDVPISETPRAVSVVTETQIEERGAQKIDQALRYSSGILATPYGPDNKAEWVTIRGFSDQSRFQNGLATLNEDGFYGQQIEPFGVERIEVLKGPASVLYGQNPPGGLVNVITKRPTRLPQGKVELEYGSNDYRHLAVDSAGPLNDDGSVLYRVVALARDTSGEMDFSKSKRLYLAPSVTLLGEDTELTVLASYMETKSDTTNGFKLPYGTLHDTPFGKVGYKTSLGEPGMNRHDTRQFSLGYEFTHHLNDTWTFHQNVNYTYLNLDLRNAYALSMANDRQANRGLTYRDGFAQNWATDNRLVGEWQWEDIENTLLLGFDYRRANTQSRDGNLYAFGDPIDIFNPVYGNYTSPDSQLFAHRSGRHQTGYYVQNQIKYDERLIVLLGGRYDVAKSRDRNFSSGADTRTDDTKFTKTAGVMYLFDNGISPYVSYSESFLPVSGRDGYERPYVPEEGQQTEVGVKYTPEGFNGYASAALFNLEQKNVKTTDPKNPSLTIQAGEARSRGLELELSGEVYTGLTLTANYTYNEVETTKSGTIGEVGKRLPGLPEHIVSGWATYAFNGKLEGLSIGSGVRYVGSSYGDIANSADMKVPAYTLWDAMIAYDFSKDWRLQVNATNLTNREYVSACNYWCYYGEGRNVSANVSYRW